MSVINLDLPRNEHFVQEFGITLTTVVVQNRRTGKWKNLLDVWEYSRDESTFRRYLQVEMDIMEAARADPHAGPRH